jgi:acyl-CoA synthetase (AMP-forming)/AMP-acid ligase II
MDSRSDGVVTMIDVLRAKASKEPDFHIYRFLDDGETVADSLTYGQLDRRAREIAAELQRRFPPRALVLLVVPPGLDGIAGFFGALYAGIIPVPLFPPQDASAIARMKKTAADAQVSGVLTTSALAGPLSAGGIPVVVADQVPADADAWNDPRLGAGDLAFLQYTSGSTGDPKGVMVAHGTLILTCHDIDRAFLHDANSVMVTWLPTFHDMGLIYGVLLPLLIGFPCYVMSPVTFLRQPIRWLRAISTYRGTHSAAPNFAYDLCVRRTTAEERRALDLSSWRVASNGAEPIRASSLTEFANAFATSGFPFASFCPSYGMAEATLKITTTRVGKAPRILRLEGEALEQGRVVPAGDGRPIVGCGWSNIGAELAIVDPETCKPRGANEVGEVWVSSPSVAQGYWRRPEQTEKTFRAHTSDGRGPFLRTGDLGFLYDGDELFITGRLKDLLIIRGRNHYPQDLELTAERADPAVRPGCTAAFLTGDDRVALLVETQAASEDPQAVLRKLRAAVAAEHGVAVSDLVVFPPGTLPKTSSGKIRRAASHELLLSGAPGALAEWHRR